MFEDAINKPGPFMSFFLSFYQLHLIYFWQFFIFYLYIDFIFFVFAGGGGRADTRAVYSRLLLSSA